MDKGRSKDFGKKRGVKFRKTPYKDWTKPCKGLKREKEGIKISSQMYLNAI